jgi:hypothetical protein
MASTIVQILAILIGGAFAIIKFGIVIPQRCRRISAYLENSDGSRVPPLCRPDLQIEITNLSKSSIEVKKLRGQAWFVDEPSSSQKKINYFDIRTAIKSNSPVEAFSYGNGPLVQTYAPGQSARNTFEWLVERRKNAYVLFLIEAFAELGDEKPLDHQDQWDLVCGEDDKGGAEKTK